MIKIEEIKELEESLKKNNVFVAASIEGKGCHIGKFKGFGLDANDELIIEVDINSKSSTTESIMTAEEYKKNALTLLNYCLTETINTAEEDKLEDEELEKHESYCEGLKDAILKIQNLPTEVIIN